MLALAEPGLPRRCLQERNDRPATPEETKGASGLNWEHLPAAGEPIPIRNRDRTVGARLAGELAYRGHPQTLGGKTVELHFRGSAGQSFGAFTARGMRFVLTGEANDYVGKGLSGADLVLRPAGLAARAPHENVILGNVALYGATSGRLFAGGTAGERFAIRNSGADAVVEGVGDHACEYMTGGRVVVLGDVGWNFGAGMTGGEAYVYDAHDQLEARLNRESVLARSADEGELARLRLLLEEHVAWTGSARASALLAAWGECAPRFRKVSPLVDASNAAQPGVALPSASGVAP
jgi:glutamate synthase domain-containing protein 3